MNIILGGGISGLTCSYELKNNSWPRQITRDFSGGSMLEGSDTALAGEEKQVNFKLNMILKEHESSCTL